MPFAALETNPEGVLPAKGEDRHAERLLRILMAEAPSKPSRTRKSTSVP